MCKKNETQAKVKSKTVSHPEYGEIEINFSFNKYLTKINILSAGVKGDLHVEVEDLDTELLKFLEIEAQKNL